MRIDIAKYLPDLPPDHVLYYCSNTFVVALTAFRGDECYMSYASNGPITKLILYRLWAKPFLQLHCNRVYGFTPEANVKAMSFAKAMGCKPDNTKQGPPGYHHFVMFKEECKWIKDKSLCLDEYIR